MTLLDRGQVLRAAHELYCSSVVTRLDELRRRNPYPRDWAAFCEWVTPLDDCDQLSIMWRLLGRVEQAWGYDVGLVFHHMGIETDRQADALYYLLMGCMGSGVSLADDYDAALERASEILLRYPAEDQGQRYFDPAPIDFEEVEWTMAAENAFPGDVDEEGS